MCVNAFSIMCRVPVFCTFKEPAWPDFYIHTSHIPKDQSETLPGPSRHDALSRQSNNHATIRLLAISYGSLDLDATNGERSATSDALSTSADARKQVFKEKETIVTSALLAYLEESAQPPDLEEGLSNDDADDERVPPLDSAVGALGRVAVGSFAEDNVHLLVLDLLEEVGEAAD